MAESKEEMNYWRIISLLYKVAPSAVRVKFDEEFHPTNGLEQTLKQDKWRVLEPLKRKKIIHQVQWDLLFPISGTVSSTTFDLTLMICLIRHLTPIQIGDIVPHSTDVSAGADLSRLKYYRNKFAHHDGCRLTERDFEIYWSEIFQAILRLGGQQFKHICEDVRDMTLNNNEKEILLEIRNLEKASTFVPKALQIGSSGCGKSTAIHHVALRLHNQEGYNIVPVHYPEDIIQYCEPKYKQVFVIDDICGKSVIDVGLVNRWETVSTDLKKIIDDHKIKILISCRKHIYLDRSYQGVALLSKTMCDLVANHSLTDKERNQIARTYLTENEVISIEKSGLVDKFSFFPLLCYLYTKQKLTDIRDFFTNPISVIRGELDLLRKATDQTTLATLSLFIVYNNCLDEDMLARSHKVVPNHRTGDRHRKVLLHVSKDEISYMLLSMTRQCYWDMVPILLTYQVDVNVRDWKGTPLYFASEKGNIDIAKLLLDHQADPNMKGWLETASQSPLHVAVDTCNIDLVNLLLNRNADANIKDIILEQRPHCI
ncbi:unnamed protein product [Mytilus edulis]|uniref:DZIP3-like HEPN domain-containing protein n=1 Tax=Mytilus edulis TaxID=6550 RepID=A0A8S3U2G1_MYTED|nr:unnamed protein product [Mytilus edulis]